MTTIEESKKSDKIKTLDELIEKKSKIITIIGVFGALTIFSTSLEGAYYLITFGCLAIFLVLCWEFYKHIPHEDEPEAFISTLNVFKYLFFFGFLMPIYGYVAYFAFKLHPGVKIIFILFFIAVPCLNFSFSVLNNWEKNPEIAQLKDKRPIQHLWIIIIILFLTIPLEIAYIATKILEIIL